VVFKADKPGEAQDTLCEDITAHRLLNWKPTHSVLEYIKSLKIQE
jgi:hypothetical protein